MAASGGEGEIWARDVVRAPMGQIDEMVDPADPPPLYLTHYVVRLYLDGSREVRQHFML